MPLIDQIELLGAAVDDGIITRDAAAQLLVDHADGPLDTRGALNYLDQHRTVRADHNDRITSIAALLACAEDIQRAATPEEHAAAWLRTEVEVALQREAQRQRMRAQAFRLLRRNLDTTNPEEV